MRKPSIAGQAGMRYKFTQSEIFVQALIERSAVWKFLLILTMLELVLAFVSFAIVRAGAERYPVEPDNLGDIQKA